VLDDLKVKLANPLELSEANLKALVMYQNLLETLFDGIFKQIRVQKEIEGKK